MHLPKVLLQRVQRGECMLKISIIGLGARGAEVYGKYIMNHLNDAQIVQIADPDEEKRNKYQDIYHLGHDAVFTSGHDLILASKIADALIIATPDQQHFADVMLALEYGYDILLEKPISPYEHECLMIRDKAIEKKRRVVLCHVLRYAPMYQKIKTLIDEKTIGDLVLIDQIEHIGYWHFAHSFVRGNWRNKELSAPIILAKTCHDFDNILWFMNDHVDRVSSMGNLFYFRNDKKPKGATSRCLDGCKVKDQCPYDAEKIYLTNHRLYPEESKNAWPFIVLDPKPTQESLRKAIQEGPYGRCIYDSDNNVMDHQVVNIAFKGGTHAHLTLAAHTGSTYRQIKIMGTLGEIMANDRDQIIEIKRFDGSFDIKPEVIDIKKMTDSLDGHGGGDERLMSDFIKYIEQGHEGSTMLTSIEQSIESHMIAFAAERSRMLKGKLIYLHEREE